MTRTISQPPRPGGPPTEQMPDLSHGICVDMPAELFSPTDPHRPDQEALTACAACPVRADCATYGRATKATSIHGGMSLVRGEPVTVLIPKPRRARRSDACRVCDASVTGQGWYCEPCRIAVRRDSWRQAAHRRRDRQAVKATHRPVDSPVDNQEQEAG